MREIVTERVEIPVSDGTRMPAYTARPAAGQAAPGIVIFQEIFGVNAHIRDLAERFARLGYVAVAPELFHRVAPGYEGSYDDIPASMEVAKRLTPAELEADIDAVVGYLQTSPLAEPGRLAAIGYCMGGRLAFMANARQPLQAAVSYYGSIAPAGVPLASQLSGPMLLFWAGRDGYIPAESRRAVADALHGAGKRFVDVVFSHANHGFFCDARGDYDPAAAAQAWSLTVTFLETYLCGGRSGT